jgi:hypothetical protein
MDLTGSEYGQMADVCENGKKFWFPYKIGNLFAKVEGLFF